MDATLGTWKIQLDKSEGFNNELAKVMEMTEQDVKMLSTTEFTVIFSKENDTYKAVYQFAGGQPIVQGPFKLGETFNFKDDGRHRVEQITVTEEGGKVVEHVKIQDSDLEWKNYRYIQDGCMIAEMHVRGMKTKTVFVQA